MAPPHLVFKNALLKPFREFGFWGEYEPPVSLLGPVINLSLLQTPMFWFVWPQHIGHMYLRSVTRELSTLELFSGYLKSRVQDKEAGVRGWEGEQDRRRKPQGVSQGCHSG